MSLNYVTGLVEHVITVIQDVFPLVWTDHGDGGEGLPSQDSDQALSVMQACLDLISSILKLVSEVVRRALQVCSQLSF